MATPWCCDGSGTGQSYGSAACSTTISSARRIPADEAYSRAIRRPLNAAAEPWSQMANAIGAPGVT